LKFVTKCNPANERVKRKYVLVLATGRGEESIDAAAIDRFDEFNRRKGLSLRTSARLPCASGDVDQRVPEQVHVHFLFR
jgi:hypothetical protein